MTRPKEPKLIVLSPDDVELILEGLSVYISEELYRLRDKLRKNHANAICRQLEEALDDSTEGDKTDHIQSQ